MRIPVVQERNNGRDVLFLSELNQERQGHQMITIAQTIQTVFACTVPLTEFPERQKSAAQNKEDHK